MPAREKTVLADPCSWKENRMILCCGEALIDMLPRESTAGEPAFAPYPGGARVQQRHRARAAWRRRPASSPGFPAIFSASMLREALAASNVERAIRAISDRPTTLAFVRLTDGHASYAFYDENTAGRMLDDCRPAGARAGRAGAALRRHQPDPGACRIDL